MARRYAVLQPPFTPCLACNSMASFSVFYQPSSTFRPPLPASRPPQHLSHGIHMHLSFPAPLVPLPAQLCSSLACSPSCCEAPLGVSVGGANHLADKPVLGMCISLEEDVVAGQVGVNYTLAVYVSHCRCHLVGNHEELLHVERPLPDRVAEEAILIAVAQRSLYRE